VSPETFRVPTPQPALGFLLESSVSDPTFLAKVPDPISIIASTFDNGARRTEQFELKKATEGKWESTATFRL
jgi:hypothetical protein